jgi:hypothetical protein
MTKYNIEGGLDFFTELYKSLDIEEEEFKTDEDKNLCLITNQPLKENYFKMECGHNFNYIPLYNDLKNHKQKFNSMEGTTSKLFTNEIRCPYCRKKQTGLLPYYEELGLNKINGVNYIDTNIKTPKSSYNNYNTCEFLNQNMCFDPSGNNPVETDPNNNNNCKFLKCFNLGSKINYCQGITEGENYGDEKYYCWNHKKQIVKKYKQAIKDNIKEEAKKTKLKEKEELNKAKYEEKQKAKDEKQKAKEEAKKANKPKQLSENVVLGPSIITDLAGNELIIGCQEILKSGPNKGTHCGCKIVYENICKRHFMMKHKELIIHN